MCTLWAHLPGVPTGSIGGACVAAGLGDGGNVVLVRVELWCGSADAGSAGGIPGEDQRVSKRTSDSRTCTWDETNGDNDWLPDTGIGSKPDQCQVQGPMAADWGDDGSNQGAGIEH